MAMGAQMVDEDLLTLSWMGIGIIGLAVARGYVISVVNVLIIGISAMVLIFSNDTYKLLHLYIGVCAALYCGISLSEAKFYALRGSWTDLFAPLRIGTLLCLIIGLAAIGNRSLLLMDEHLIWLSAVALMPMVMYVAFVLQRPFNLISQGTNRLILGLLLLVLILCGMAPSVLGAVLIILLGFGTNHRAGLAVGILALLYFVSQYYYDLNLSLLVKSGILLGSGLLLLLIYYLVFKKPTHP